ncbi:integrase catalytic domain-containing protein [Thalassotalea sp. ND16A]|uniref:integrase catalytic domain-containing protein n=1 Tax=Thalassotalea sp. ND16A TaxID=1535422 RepID=UPI000519F7D2|nr:DDE-type integrase/transposase/recombinase [Thalassotalea sp. ND16A]KGJ89811.1 hypothetical protein ND16A_2082 [Thalassotalea sp. ND16A]
MQLKERRSYLITIKRRYLKAGKKDKKAILNEFCIICNYNRKYAIRLLNKTNNFPVKKKPGRKPRYNSKEFITALKRIWFASDQMCSKRLKAVIPIWLPFYEVHYQKLSDETCQSLLAISAASIDRVLKPTRVKFSRKGLTGTRPGTLLKNQIPIRTDTWDITEPGYMEADTVAHCGNSLAGDFVWSLTLTDYHSGWTECRATWNKGATGVVAQIKTIEKALPFPLKGFDCDNGSEFLNYHLLRYFQEHPRLIQFTRSRPYKKNDNAHVEQKNWTHVRQLFGYDRFEDKVLVSKMNNLYAKEWSLFQNYFCPTMKLKEKIRENSRYLKKYYKPQTPYQRLLDSKSINRATKNKLKTQYQQLDPFQLKTKIERKLKVIFKLITVTPNVRIRI